ncbi:MAG: TonB-dependent receptor [Acidobacteria bacterium]|nr:MAG: TonB-dependent receptor [Acidobacteriota bacterium]
MCRRSIPFWLCLVLLLCAGPLLAQQAASQSGDEDDAAAEEAEEVVSDTIVVTASRTEQRIHEVPAAITVLDSTALEHIPADNFGDFLRNVPGLNVSQMTTRDIAITGRSATFSLADSELVLMDNRTLYLDFFGFVMWDFFPVDPQEIKQLEVVRGPGSAVWGANAVNGVINLITKPPREMEGTSITFGGGELDTIYGSVTHAGVADKLSYKLTAAYYQQDEPYERPTGTIPGTEGPTNPGGTPYPEYENQGTKQPKFNFRVDYDQNEQALWSFSGGYSGTDGILYSGIGPFDIDTGTSMTFGKVDWTRKAIWARFYVNLLDGEAVNLLTRGIDGQPLQFAFDSNTYHIEAGNTSVVGRDRHILTYGASARQNNFDLSIAPDADERQEFGVFLQDEILLGEKWRWLIGARWDDIDPIGSVVSPRTTLMFNATPQQTFRLSYNRAFKAPSMINNFLEIVLVNQVTLPMVGPYVFPTLALGNPDLVEERLDAYEFGWVGTFGKATATISVYRNETKDDIDFFPAVFYSSQNPPPGWPLPPPILDVPPPFGLKDTLPAAFSYRNVGEVIDKGAELSLQYRPSLAWSAFVNYSYQDRSDVKGVEPVLLPSGEIVDPVNIPPKNRFNIGGFYSGALFFVNGNVNYVDEAFWTDVLDSRFWGPTDSYFMVNLGAGVYLADDHLTLSVRGQNVLDEDIQQHVMGDIISRKITAQILYRF